jgi:hypothetical protein
MTRPVQERLEEYATAMRSTAEQMDALATHLLSVHPDNDVAPIREGVRLYLLFADDLDKLVAGEELKPFIVTGVL